MDPQEIRQKPLQSWRPRFGASIKENMALWTVHFWVGDIQSWMMDFVQFPLITQWNQGFERPQNHTEDTEAWSSPSHIPATSDRPQPWWGDQGHCRWRGLSPHSSPQAVDDLPIHTLENHGHIPIWMCDHRQTPLEVERPGEIHKNWIHWKHIQYSCMILAWGMICLQYTMGFLIPGFTIA